MVSGFPTGPDLVLAGAARSGTSSLAAQLGAHPDIDPGKVKESNYFSSKFHRGSDWYEGLYSERQDGLLRLDASTSYTSPQFPEALSRLVEAAPEAFVIYAVRQPTERALSHYFLRRYYFQNDKAADFGSALRESSFYADASDYAHWLPVLRKTFPDRNLLVVPFEVIISSPDQVTAEICRQLGLSTAPDAQQHGQQHRNDVVQYRNQTTRKFARQFRRSPAYPWVRNAVGAGRLRKARGLITQDAHLPASEAALASCDSSQTQMLHELDKRAGQVVHAYLTAQDARLDLAWAPASFAMRHA